MITAENYVVGWHPYGPAYVCRKGDPKLGSYPNFTGLGVEYCPDADTPEKVIIRMLADFHALVVRDRVPLDHAHMEFLKIREYRSVIASDIKGAE